MLEVKNLHANVNGKEILKGINLSVKAGEVPAIMGPNGSGKSTLSSVLVGNPAFEVTEGEVIFNGKNLLDLSPEDRSREGIFLSFQYPVEIPGVSNVQFLRESLNAQRTSRGEKPLSGAEFLKLAQRVRDGITGSEYQRPAEADDYGRVDFDDDEGTTIATLHIEGDPLRPEVAFLLKLDVNAPVIIHGPGGEYIGTIHPM